MSFRNLILAAVLGLTPAGALASGPTAPQPSRAVDLQRFYSGTWIEIGRRPMKLTDGCVAGATTYRIVSPTRIAVVDTCHAGTPAGKLKSIGGPARIRDPGANAKLHVTYRFLGFIPVARDYWVLDHDEDYGWFISADPRFHDLWIYTRATRPDPALTARLVERAKALGYDVSKLEFPAQP